MGKRTVSPGIVSADMPIGKFTATRLVQSSIDIEAYVRGELAKSIAQMVDEDFMGTRGRHWAAGPPRIGIDRYDPERITIDLPKKATAKQKQRIRVALAAIMGGKELGMWDSHGPVDLDPHHRDALSVLLAEAELLSAEQKALDLGGA